MGKDLSCGAMPRASVAVTNSGTQQKGQTLTTGAGIYSFILLPPGEQSLRVNQTGLLDFLRNQILLDVAGVAVVDVTLEAAAATETVMVAGAAEQPQIGHRDWATSPAPKGGENGVSTLLTTPICFSI